MTNSISHTYRGLTFQTPSCLPAHVAERMVAAWHRAVDEGRVITTDSGHIGAYDAARAERIVAAGNGARFEPTQAA